MKLLKNKKPRVLLLDDDEDYCRQMMMLLENDYMAEYATTSARFLSMASKRNYQLYLVDYSLHEKANDGLKVIKSLRQKPITSNAAILMLSGVSEPAILKKAFVSGIDDYVIKPVIPAYLLPKMENLLFQNRKKMQSQALTGLPGNKLIEEEFKSRIVQNQNFSAAYVDLDNFKPFNDEKGVDKGDKAILAMSNLLWETRNFYTRNQLFLGHLGGDDFFLIGKKHAVLESISVLRHKFGQMIKPFFTPAELRRGWYTATGRDGLKHKYEILSFSAAVLHIPSGFSGRFSNLSPYFSRLKKLAKKDSTRMAELKLSSAGPKKDRSNATLFTNSLNKDRNSKPKEADKRTWA